MGRTIAVHRRGRRGGVARRRRQRLPAGRPGRGEGRGDRRRRGARGRGLAWACAGRRAGAWPRSVGRGRRARRRAGPTQVDGRVKASPLARRIARERGIELSAISGTGPEGRIVAEDVERAAAQPQPALQQVAATTVRAGRRGGGGRAHLDPEDDRAPPHRGVAGARVPDLHVRRHDAHARAARAPRRAEAGGRGEADRLGRAHEGLRRRAHAPPRGERALRGRPDPALPDRQRRHRRRGAARPARARREGRRPARRSRRSRTSAPTSSRGRATRS